MARMQVPREVKEGEAQLTEFARGLSRPIDGLTRPQVVALGLGNRGWSLYRGFRHALNGPSLNAAHVDLRSVLDVTILARWMEVDPALRVRLWLAEDSRQQILGGDAYSELRQRRGNPSVEVFPPAERTAMKDEIASARTAAKLAGLAVGDAGSVLPNEYEMAREVDHLWELYNIAYRSLSPSMHAGGRSFVGDEVVKRADGHHLVHKSPFASAALRSLAVPTVCMLFASVSRQVGLGIEAECDAVRLRVLLPPP
jgi:hypothetical protein